MYVGIYIKTFAFSRTSPVVKELSILSHKMAAASEVANGNDFGIALVMTGAMFDDVHASCQIWETKVCKPFNVHEWTGKF